jgi:hypothetical protein
MEPRSVYLSISDADLVREIDKLALIMGRRRFGDSDKKEAYRRRLKMCQATLVNKVAGPMPPMPIPATSLIVYPLSYTKLECIFSQLTLGATGVRGARSGETGELRPQP